MLNGQQVQLRARLDRGAMRPLSGTELTHPGCIIQSDAIADFLLPACEAADKDRSDQLLLDERVASELGRRYAALKAVVLQATENDAVVSSLSASLSWLKAWGNERLPTSFQESEMDAFGHRACIALAPMD